MQLASGCIFIVAINATAIAGARIGGEHGFVGAAVYVPFVHIKCGFVPINNSRWFVFDRV